MSLELVRLKARQLEMVDQYVQSLRRDVVQQEAHLAQAEMTLLRSSDDAQRARVGAHIVVLQSGLEHQQVELCKAEEKLQVAFQQFEAAVDSYKRPEPAVPILQIWMWKARSWLALLQF